MALQYNSTAAWVQQYRAYREGYVAVCAKIHAYGSILATATCANNSRAVRRQAYMPKDSAAAHSTGVVTGMAAA